MPDTDLTVGDAVIVDLTPRGRGKKNGEFVGAADDPHDHRVKVDGDYVDVMDHRVEPE